MMTEENNTIQDVAEESAQPDVAVAEPAAAPDTLAEAASGEPAEAEENPETSGEKEKETKKLFGKKKDKKDKKDEKIEELTDQLKRQMAEFENFRKRTNQEKAGMYVIGAREIVEKMLPIVDSFERGLAAVPEEDQKDPFVDGMNKVYKQLMAALEEAGVQAIEAMGQEFDPNIHNAVMHVENEEVGDNIIIEEFQKGYLFKDFVVRHSMVKVAN